MGLFSGWLDSNTSTIANAFEGLNTEAYNPEATIFGTDTTITDIAMLPFEYSFKLNSARQAWNMSKAWGVTSSISDPFSKVSVANRSIHANKMLKYNGFLGDVLDDISNIGVRSNEPRRKWQQSLKDHGSKGTFNPEFAKPGFVERQLLDKKKFHQTMGKINSNYLEAYQGDQDKAYDAFVQKTIKAREAQKRMPDSTRKMIMDNMDQIHQSRMKTTKQFLKGTIDEKAEDLLGENGFLQRDNLGRQRFSLFGRKASTSRKQAMAAVTEGLRESVIESGGNIASIGEHISDYSNEVGRRLGIARKLKGAMWIGGAATVAIPMAAMALKAYMTVPTRVASTLEKLNRRDFGSGEMLQNNSVATERQRALMAIRDGQLNARSIMGNEAAFMH